MIRGSFALAVGLLLGLGLFLALEPLPEPLTRGRGELAIEDARGLLLREHGGADGLRAEWVRLEAVPKLARDALVQTEDRRFDAHFGIDPWGLARALEGALGGRRAGGGSTLAMQVARLSYGIPRSALGKLAQLARGAALQLRLGRAGVLEAYLNLAPFGRDVRGIAEASRTYFGKPLRDLTRGEALALACLPHAPSRYDPYQRPERLRRRRAAVLALLHARGLVSEVERAESAREPIVLVPFTRPFRAPHAAAQARVEARSRVARGVPTRLRTTLEPALQRAAEWACTRAVDELARGLNGPGTGCAAVVLRVATAEVLALVGSEDFAAPEGGQVNGALALRQPGSALKPFVYALAFERGDGPGTRIVDAPTRFSAAFGDYVPENYDRRFHGVVTLREALACSYNVPAARLCASLGPSRLLERLRALGLESLDRAAEHYGVGLALGVGEVRLLDLVGAYATLARGGEHLAPTLLAEALRDGVALPLVERPRRRVFSRAVSYLVTHVLADPTARRAAFGQDSVLALPFDASVKTGTSSGYRDNWALGYTDEVAVGVWVGRLDGAPLAGVAGVSGAGPALRHLLLTAAGPARPRLGPPPPGVVVRSLEGGGHDLALSSVRAE